MTRLLVVDDVPLFRAGLTSALTAAGFEVAGEAGSAETAVAKAEEHQPDLVLLDVLMPGLSGLDVVEKITAVSPHSSVVLLTGSESEEDMLTALKAGARGYIVKDMPFPVLVDSIVAVADATSTCPCEDAGRLGGSRKGGQTDPGLHVDDVRSYGFTGPAIASGGIARGSFDDAFAGTSH